MSVDHAKDDLDPEALPNHTGPITGELVCISKVRIAAFLQLFLIYFWHEGFCQSQRLLSGQRWRVRPHGLENSMDSPDWRRGCPQMNVRGARLLADLEIIIHMWQGMRRDRRS